MRFKVIACFVGLVTGIWDQGPRIMKGYKKIQKKVFFFCLYRIVAFWNANENT